MFSMVNNKLVLEALTKFRDEQSSVHEANDAVKLISTFLAGEVSNRLDYDEIDVSTPLGCARGVMYNDHIELIAIARAGLAMLPSFQQLFHVDNIAIIGASRNPDLSINIPYETLSHNMSGKTAIILDPVLATGSTINEVINLTKSRGCNKIIVACILATNDGLHSLAKFDDIDIVCVTSSETLDAKNYIYPGIGDSGDRLFGSRKKLVVKE